jgi:hypothetical protein
VRVTVSASDPLHAPPDPHRSVSPSLWPRTSAAFVPIVNRPCAGGGGGVVSGVVVVVFGVVVVVVGGDGAIATSRSCSSCSEPR